MEDERRREIGLFRYALIRPAADPDTSRAEHGRLVRALAGAEHLGPGGGLVRVGRTTLDDWIRAYRRGGFEALVPRPRGRGCAHAGRGAGVRVLTPNGKNDTLRITIRVPP